MPPLLSCPVHQINRKHLKAQQVTQSLCALLLTLICIFGTVRLHAQEIGVTEKTIRIGGVMDLKGYSGGLGQSMKTGIEAALNNKEIQGRSIEYIMLDDSYNPRLAVEMTEKLIDQGIFLMMGNVGTPTAKAVLPILARHQVPAVGFFTGASLLRPGIGDVLNFRASYVQEVASVIEIALSAGLEPSAICAYVQNDAYGMAGVEGLKIALINHPGTVETVAVLDRMVALQGPNPERNKLGPVGVYRRNTLKSREGYKSLVYWEEIANVPCRLIVTVGTYTAIANFIAYARFKNKNWIYSALSFTGADYLKTELTKQEITSGVIMTQVVPPLDSALPIVQQARTDLDDQLNYVSLEGYLVGELFLTIMRAVEGEITRENFLQTALGHRFDLGGLEIDFTEDNQGSDLVVMTYLQDGDYINITAQDLRAIFQAQAIP